MATDKREKAVQELFDSEKVFLRNLRTALEVYGRLLPHVVPADEAEQVFGPLRDITAVAIGLLRGMSECGLGSTEATPIHASIRLSTLQKVALSIKPGYIVYAQKYTSALRMIKHWQDGSEFAVNAMNVARKDKRTNHQTLESYLIMPIQRLPRHKMLLAEILKHTPPDHPDRTMLEELEQVFSNVAMEVNAAIVRSDEIDQLLALEQKLSRSASYEEVYRPGRRLLKEGYVNKLSRRGLQSRALFLLSDMLMYASSTVNGAVLSKPHMVPLQACKFEKGSLIHSYEASWTVRGTAKSFVLVHDAVEERDEWIQAVTKQQQRLRELAAAGKEAARIRSGAKGGETVASDEMGLQTAPVWEPNSSMPFCWLCGRRYTLVYRRRHCRKCGRLCCERCSEARRVLSNIGPDPVRICSDCVEEEESSSDSEDELWEKCEARAKQRLEESSSEEEKEVPVRRIHRSSLELDKVDEITSALPALLFTVADKGPLAGRAFRVNKPTTVIGRGVGQGCDIVIPGRQVHAKGDDSVSKRHCIIEWREEEKKYYVKTIAKKNFTLIRLGGQQRGTSLRYGMESPIASGCILGVGKTTFFRIRKEGEAPPRQRKHKKESNALDALGKESFGAVLRDLGLVDAATPPKGSPKKLKRYSQPEGWVNGDFEMLELLDCLEVHLASKGKEKRLGVGPSIGPPLPSHHVGAASKKYLRLDLE